MMHFGQEYTAASARLTADFVSIIAAGSFFRCFGFCIVRNYSYLFFFLRQVRSLPVKDDFPAAFFIAAQPPLIVSVIRIRIQGSAVFFG